MSDNRSHLWTTTFGNIAFAPPSNPDTPSIEIKKTSSTIRFLISSTIITDVTENDIKYSGHTSTRINASLKDVMSNNGEIVYIIKIKDILKEWYEKNTNILNDMRNSINIIWM